MRGMDATAAQELQSHGIRIRSSGSSLLGTTIPAPFLHLDICLLPFPIHLTVCSSFICRPAPHHLGFPVVLSETCQTYYTRPKIGRSSSTSAGDRPGTCPPGNRAPANPYAAASRPGTVHSGAVRTARAATSQGGEKPGPKPPRMPKSRPATVPTNAARPRRHDPSRPAKPAAANLDAGSVATTFMEMSPPPGVSDAVMGETRAFLSCCGIKYTSPAWRSS